MSNTLPAAEEARQARLAAEAESRMRESMQTLAFTRRARGETVSTAISKHDGVRA